MHYGVVLPIWQLTITDAESLTLRAEELGLDAVFVSSGIHAGEPFPHDFAKKHGLGDWAPVAVVESLL